MHLYSDHHEWSWKRIRVSCWSAQSTKSHLLLYSVIYSNKTVKMRWVLNWESNSRGLSLNHIAHSSSYRDQNWYNVSMLWAKSEPNCRTTTTPLSHIQSHARKLDKDFKLKHIYSQTMMLVRTFHNIAFLEIGTYHFNQWYISPRLKNWEGTLLCIKISWKFCESVNLLCLHLLQNYYEFSTVL